jgi:DNA-binding FadR family transcriptional regulator
MKPLYQSIYQYNKWYHEKHGETPTGIQIGAHFGFTREYIRQVFDQMEKEGLIERQKRSRVFYKFNVERFDEKHN